MYFANRFTAHVFERRMMTDFTFQMSETAMPKVVSLRADFNAGLEMKGVVGPAFPDYNQ